MRGLLKDRPPAGGMGLLRLWQELVMARPEPYSPLSRLRALALRLAEGFRGLLPASARPQGAHHPRPSEQAIGRFRIRAKAMRGRAELN